MSYIVMKRKLRFCVLIFSPSAPKNYFPMSTKIRVLSKRKSTGNNTYKNYSLMRTRRFLQVVWNDFVVNALIPKHWYFANDILNVKFYMFIKILIRFVPNGSNGNSWALFQVTAWGQLNNCEPILLAQKCVTGPECVIIAFKHCIHIRG